MFSYLFTAIYFYRNIVSENVESNQDLDKIKSLYYVVK